MAITESLSHGTCQRRPVSQEPAGLRVPTTLIHDLRGHLCGAKGQLCSLQTGLKGPFS